MNRIINAAYVSSAMQQRIEEFLLNSHLKMKGGTKRETHYHEIACKVQEAQVDVIFIARTKKYNMTCRI